MRSFTFEDVKLAHLGCFVVLGACSPFAVGDEATGGATGGTTQTSSAPSATASGPAASTASVTAATASSGAGPAASQVYTRDAATGTWTATPVDVFWPGSDAPPAKGITAVADLQKFDDLFVFVDLGGASRVHRRRNGLWLPPVPVEQTFVGLFAGTRVESAFHVPYWAMKTSGCGPPPSPLNESVRLVTDQGAVWDFEVAPDGTVSQRSDAGNPGDWTTGLYAGPALPTWTVEVAPDPNACGALGWYALYAFMADGVYFSDGTLVEPVDPLDPHFLWRELPITAFNPIFKGQPDEPAPAAMVAGFYDRPTETFGFVGP